MIYAFSCFLSGNSGINLGQIYDNIHSCQLINCTKLKLMQSGAIVLQSFATFLVVIMFWTVWDNIEKTFL